jgi:hypothetical protein
MRVIVLIAWGLLLIASPVRAAEIDSIDGTWEGTLSRATGPGLLPGPETVKFRIVIAGSRAHIFLAKENGELEVKPGAFHVIRYMSNAVVVAIDSSHDKDGIWVETWDFSVTLKDRNTLITNYFRTVNNTDQPPEASHSKWSTAATGELARVP